MDARVETVLSFLTTLQCNNNRVWFQANRPCYEAARLAFGSIVVDLIARIAAFEPDVVHLAVKDCTYRIYRDTRFSLDKSPYKTHFGAYINPKGKKSLHGGYYFHLQPGECLLAGGSWGLPTPLLTKLRESIYYAADEFRAIVEAPAFKALYSDVGQEKLKVAPKGFAKDFPLIDYLKVKDYTTWYNLSPEFFASPDWLEQVADHFKVMKPFLDFINYTINEAEHL